MTKTLWEHTAGSNHSYPTLNKHLEADIVIIGGGITGVTAAYELAKSNKKIILIEKDTIGSSTTGNSTGNLYVPVQPYYSKITKKFNFTVANTIAQSRAWAIDYIEQLVQQNNLNCHFFRRPWFLHTNENIKLFEQELRTFNELGLPIKEISDLPLPIPFKKAATLPNQARMNPLAYVRELAALLTPLNVEIFENTHALKISEDKLCKVTTPNGSITSQQVIIATHTPLGINTAHIFTAPYRSYVVAAHIEYEYPDGVFWDLESPHHALSTHPEIGDLPSLMLIAGEHHKTGQNNPEDHLAKLQQYFSQHFPIKEYKYIWSAQHYRSADLVPYIGPAHRTSKNMFMATGYFADGLVYGTIAAKLLSDLILEKQNDWQSIYNAKRIDFLRSAGFLLKENSNNFLQYLKDYLLPHAKDIKKIKKGTGKVLSIKGNKCAVYRDPEGCVHKVSAICTHLKCVVDWNNVEKTWDCPCHGSRFATDGSVIEGPATKPLEKM